MLSADLQAAFAGPAAVVHPAGEVRFVGLPQAPLRYAPSFLQLRTGEDPHSYKGGNEEDDALRGRFDLRFPEAREKDKRKNTKERIGQVLFSRVPPARVTPHPTNPPAAGAGGAHHVRGGASPHRLAVHACGVGDISQLEADEHTIHE